MGEHHLVVIGIGAMGGGMARALLDAPVAKRVVGYDKSTAAVGKFHGEAKALSKAGHTPPLSLQDAISSDTNFAIMSLVNESQCEQVCFGDDNNNLLSLMPKGSCVILTSTVTATWAKKADEKFRGADIQFVDCPVSGGPVRARQGDLTMIASGEETCLNYANPILDALAGELHIIKGGAGGGSTVKCVHQLLAGVHICAAAEAMAMAAKAGLDVDQLYQIVNGAAGASWMFTDRGQRMLKADPEVKSALAIFVKDLDIVYAEAKKLTCPIPLATAALQQFISGQSLGLGKHDDSQVVKVYENVTRVPVVGVSASKEKSSSKELSIANDYVKAFRTPTEKNMGFAAAFASSSIKLSMPSVLIDVDLLKQPQVSQAQAMVAEKHEMLWESDRARVYKLSLLAGETVDVSYPFFRLTISSTSGQIQTGILESSSKITLQWNETVGANSLSWKEPSLNLRITNTSDKAFEQFLVEFR